MTAPIYIAVYGGFVCIEDEDDKRKCWTTPDPRQATPFSTFEEADRVAKSVVAVMYPSDLQYFALFEVAR